MALQPLLIDIGDVELEMVVDNGALLNQDNLVVEAIQTINVTIYEQCKLFLGTQTFEQLFLEQDGVEDANILYAQSGKDWIGL